MEIDDEESYPTAIAALGSMFKLTEVYLWDEASKEIQRGFSLPKHIIFKYDDDDNEDVHEEDCAEGKNNSSANGVQVDDVGDLLEEAVGLAQQMSTMGLPLSFQAKKVKIRGQKRGKRNGIIRSCSQENRQDEVLQSAKLCEKENSLGEGFKNAERINHDDIILGEDVCDESYSNLPSNGETTCQDVDSCMIIDQPQPSGVAVSSDTVVNEQDDSSYISGSFGDWTAIWDPSYTRNYFYNVKTHESTWYPPPGMEHLALSSNTDESNADPAISSNDIEVTCKNFEGDCGTNAMVHGSQVLDGDYSAPSEPCSSMDIPEQISSNGICDSKITSTTYTETVNEVEYDEFLISQVNEEEMVALAGEVEDELIPVAIKRKKKAKKSRTKKKSLSNNQEQHFQCTVDSYYGGIGKYWCQRYRLFSRFDEGIKMDEEGWFSVTPEVIARHQASRCGSGMIIDCFTGAGGNAIQFAETGRHVIAIDIDPKKIEYAKHNAAIYGVEDKIDFVIGDSFSLPLKLKADTVFLSPPWGGPEYSKVKIYDIAMLKPYDGQFLFDTFKEITSMIVMFLPRNIDVNQLAELCVSGGPLWSVEVENNFLNDRLKAVTAYFCKASV